MLCVTQVIMEEFMLELDKIISTNGFEWGMALVVEISSQLKFIFRNKKLFGSSIVRKKLRLLQKYFRNPRESSWLSGRCGILVMKFNSTYDSIRI